MSNTNSNSPESVASKLKNAMSPSIIVVVLSSGIFIALFATAFVRMSQFLGSKDDWNDIKPKVMEISLYTFFGTVAFAVATLVYMVSRETFAIYFSIIVSCLALGIAFASLAVASISR